MAPKDTYQAFGGVVKENLDNYVAGAKDTRAWGSWEALSVKVENDVVVECEKRITVNPTPMGILSLQMHEEREEVWTVEQGTLTVILNGEKIIVEQGQSIFIPRGAIHCMINETDTPVVVHEVQKGICREADNHRLQDAHGRKTDITDDIHADTILRTMQRRFSVGNDNTEGDRLMDIFMNTKPSQHIELFLEVLSHSTSVYRPFAEKVANLNQYPTPGNAKKCG